MDRTKNIWQELVRLSVADMDQAFIDHTERRIMNPYKRVTMPDGVTKAIQVVDEAVERLTPKAIAEVERLNRQVESKESHWRGSLPASRYEWCPICQIGGSERVGVCPH
jgi:hypothetical protein